MMSGRTGDWKKSTQSGNGSCVEVKIDSSVVYVRNSRDKEDASLTFTHAEWRAFCAGVHDGEFEIDGR